MSKKFKVYNYALETLFKYALIGVATGAEDFKDDLRLLTASNRILKDFITTYFEEYKDMEELTEHDKSTNTSH